MTHKAFWWNGRRWNGRRWGYAVEIPNRTTFMSLAHAILVLIFGYVGAKFATFVFEKHPTVARNGE